RLQVLVYPGLERSKDRPSMLEYGDGPSLTRENIDWMKEQYLGSDTSLDTPYGVPALAEHLQRLPEALVVLAEADPLRDGGEAYADRLFAAGVQTTVMRYPGLVHGFLSHFTRLGRADRCVSDLADALRHRLARAEGG
ncbi:MAG: alpha/beta hydrolase, partial [Actinomycetota bacterium]|nr:alpha/beta hydrolase [Actinomycetota bacterium]